MASVSPARRYNTAGKFAVPRQTCDRRPLLPLPCVVWVFFNASWCRRSPPSLIAGGVHTFAAFFFRRPGASSFVSLARTILAKSRAVWTLVVRDREHWG